MKPRLPILAAALALAAGGAALASNASAHYPEVEATFDCTDNVVHATLHATSWVTGETDRRYNASVELRWDDTVVGTGAFTPDNDYSFSLPYTTAPDGKTHTITATALVAFGPNQEYDFAGTTRDTTVTLPESCAPATTATTTTTTAPPNVLGETVTLPPAQPAVPVVVQPRFTG